MVRDTISYEEAAERLKLSVHTIRLYAKKKKLVISGKRRVTLSSVELYESKRRTYQNPVSRMSKWEIKTNKKTEELYQFIVEFFLKHGSSPSYSDLSHFMHLSISNTGRYALLLEQKGLIEIYSANDDFHKARIFLKGLRERVIEIVKDKYVDKLPG